MPDPTPQKLNGEIHPALITPIAPVFSEFKWLVKCASAWTVEALWPVSGDVLDRFTDAECRNCFKDRGYRYT